MSLKCDYNGRTYAWEDGTWYDSTRYMVAPEAIRSELDAELVRFVENKGVQAICKDQNERQGVFTLLRNSFGVTLEKLASIGFFEEVFALNPEKALVHHFKRESTPLGRSFANCKHLRDRFFSKIRPAAFELPVKLLGSGPFEESDLEHFLRESNVPLWMHDTPINAIVLGRAEWSKSEVNEIVEESEGAVLQIYSQEMLVSILAGQPDPFQTWPLHLRLWDLYAFRDGHPGLEFVSDGWSGWIKGVCSSTPLSLCSGGSDFSQVDQSPLSVMGYKVGVSGIGEEDRRRILSNAFKGVIPFVETTSYMEEWGKPSTAERLRRISCHLANLMEKFGDRANHQVAVSDWRSDLKWLHDSFYRGVFRFSWPQV